MHKDSSSPYHHGDLRRSLLDAARIMIREEGMEALSLRKLAAAVGVSRTALYHHFEDKNDLVCAIVAEGFAGLHRLMDAAIAPDAGTPRERFAAFVHGYVQLATQDAELYDLMFSRTIWKQHAPTEALRVTARDCFRRLRAMVRQWQSEGIMSARFDPKRLSQVTWSTLHGLSRLQNDGVYKDQSGLRAMCDCAIQVLLTP
ncbi:TetR/AcrR family transcriptional regulator [Aromatoleum toluclasticum]|uniref:TetR/AcrR family transcriptional regulator n=1 Tax=Aromatoleum toluclasticum TaxID=92003 RepID=UPI001D18241C|nr:TetR/AcrR family transcriptional regulator [Aromatoleum toluclasticum]MCC4117370.1 TetR/AcrR family transcriptional regulator [Aromatoleum toluclasticum]